MQSRLYAIVLVFSILVVLALLELIRRGRLREEYSLVWLFSAVCLLFFIVFKGALRGLADLLEVEYAPSVLFMVGIVFLMIIQLAQTIAMSKLTGQNRDLAQEHAILELKLHDLIGRLTLERGLELSNASDQYLQWIAREMRLCTQMPDLMHRALELTVGYFSTPNGSLLVLDNTGHLLRTTLIFRGTVVTDSEEGLDDTVRDGLSGWVLANRQPTLVTSTLEDARWLKRSWEAANRESRSAMSVPLAFNHHMVGVLTLVHPKAGRFTQKDLIVLMAIAGVISMTGGEILESMEDVEPVAPIVPVQIEKAGADAFAGEI